VKKHLMVRVFQALTGVLLGLALVLWVLRSESSRLGQDRAGYFLADPLPAPHFNLVAHTGVRVSRDMLAAELVLVFFGYTSCPDVCPLTLTHLTQALQDLGPEAQRVQVVLITVDPDRDTPERLEQYLGAFHPSFLGLTGTEIEIRAVADSFGAFFAKSGGGADYTVDHTARTFVLDSTGHIPLTFPVTATAGEVHRDLSFLLDKARLEGVP